MTETGSKIHRRTSSSGQVPVPASTNANHDQNNVVRDHRDRGRAWVVLGGSFFAGMLTSGSALSLGVLNHDITVAMPAGTSATAINMVFALTAGLNYIAGTFSPMIVARMGFRYTILTGSVLACIGFLGASFSSQIWHLLITLGFITGTGFGLVLTPSVGVVGHYFLKYKHLAATMTTTGITVGLTVFPLFHNYIASKSGFKVAMLANLGVSAGLFLCAFAVKNPPTPTTSAAVRASRPAKKERQQRHLISRVLARVRSLSLRRRRARKVGPSFTMQIIPEVIRHSVTILKMTAHTVDSKNAPATSANDAAMHNNDTEALGSVNSVTTHSTVSAPEKKPERSLLCRPKMWCLLVECFSLIAINVFLVNTPAYLMKAQGWSKSHAALAVMAHGIASFICRFVILALNAYPRFGDRISIPLQVGFGIACVFTCSASYFFRHEPSRTFLPDVAADKIHHTAMNAVLRHLNNSSQYATLNMTTVTTTTKFGPVTGNTNTTEASQQTRSVFHEQHALYYLAFAFVNGVGNTFFVAYQPSLLWEAFGALNLTQAFGLMSFVGGAGCLVLYPLAGKLGDVFGSLHYAYLLAMVCSAVSGLALILYVIMKRRTTMRRAAKAKNTIA